MSAWEDSWRRNKQDSRDEDSWRKPRGGEFRRKTYDRRTSQRNDWEMHPIDKENEPVKFEKNFYEESEIQKQMTEKEVETFRKENQMILKGKSIPKPITKFTDLSCFDEKILKAFREKGYLNATPIQAQGWPMALEGRDMVGIAQTGSGKTLSFVVPALIHAKNQLPLRKNDGPIVLVLAPTRELCLQILTEFEVYSHLYNLNCVAVYGGASSEYQKKLIMKGVEILVATPGRLIDLHESGFCPLSRVTFLVLDEADRMLDMGFMPQLKKIIPKTNKDRQTLMWSATWPQEVYNLSINYLKDAIQVNIGDERLSSNKDIKQKVLVTSHHQKKDLLFKELAKIQKDKIIIFVNTKRTADDMEYNLGTSGYSCAALHGDKTQAIRDKIISQFRDGKNLILVATDVASRGLDVKDVKLVINYDFPNTVADYVHRIGRTGRAGEKGVSVTFFTSNDSGNAKDLCKLLSEGKQEVPEELKELTYQRRGAPQKSFKRW